MKFLRSRAGQSMVEFAMVAPLLFTLLVITADFSRGFLYYSEVTTASREAARQAVLYANRGNNTQANPAPDGDTTTGVMPIIAQNSSWGYPVVYQDSNSNDSPPSYGTYTPNSNPALPGTITLASSDNYNTAYVFIYELGSSPSTRWSCPSCISTDVDPRLGSHRMVVVDVIMKFRPTTVGLVGSNFNLTIEGKTIEREEW